MYWVLVGHFVEQHVGMPSIDVSQRCPLPFELRRLILLVCGSDVLHPAIQDGRMGHLDGGMESSVALILSHDHYRRHGGGPQTGRAHIHVTGLLRSFPLCSILLHRFSDALSGM